uniref:Uncharacterized protein n=1 Tax=Arundo donax TaxID=35708 RepID=A0A0A9AJG2_ARUDO
MRPGYGLRHSIIIINQELKILAGRRRGLRGERERGLIENHMARDDDAVCETSRQR